MSWIITSGVIALGIGVLIFLGIGFAMAMSEEG